MNQYYLLLLFDRECVIFLLTFRVRRSIDKNLFYVTNCLHITKISKINKKYKKTALSLKNHLKNQTNFRFPNNDNSKFKSQINNIIYPNRNVSLLMRLTFLRYSRSLITILNSPLNFRCFHQ